MILFARAEGQGTVSVA